MRARISAPEYVPRLSAVAMLSSPEARLFSLKPMTVIPAKAEIQASSRAASVDPRFRGGDGRKSQRFIRLDGAFVGINPFGKAAPAMMIMITSAPATQ